MSQIREFLFLGSARDARNRDKLRELGITHILNITPTRDMDERTGVPCYHQSDKSLTYKRIPVFDSSAENLLPFFAAAIAFISEARHYGSVLVHCLKGVSRSASIVLAFVMHERGCSLDVAIEEVRLLRSMIKPNKAFLRQLRVYDDQLRRKRRGAASVGAAAPPPPAAAAAAAAAAASRRIGPAIGPAPRPAGGGVGAAAAAAAASAAPAPAARPIGPAIGPAPRPRAAAKRPRAAEDESSTAAVIGLAIGPQLLPARQPPPRTAIGPQLPPKRQRNGDAAAAGNTT